MTENEYTVHRMIEGFDIASECIEEYVKELIKEDKFVDDVTVEILHNGRNITYKECCDILNHLTEENKYLREKIDTKIEDETDLGISYGDILNLRYLNSLLNEMRQDNKELRHKNIELVNEVTALKYTVPKDFSEEEVRNAIWRANKRYQNFVSIMDFHDLLLIENVLMYLEMVLFEGKVGQEINTQGWLYD